MDNVASHLQRLQLGAGRRRRRALPSSSSSSSSSSASDAHAWMRRRLVPAFRATRLAPFERAPTATDSGPAPVFQVAFACAAALHSRAPRLLAAVDEDGGVALLDAATNAVQSSWTAHDNAVFDLAWAQDNAFLLTAAGDLRATAWDVETQQARFSLAGGHAMSVKCVRQSADAPDTIATGARDGHVLVWDARAPAKPIAQLRGVHSVSSTIPSGSSSPGFVSPPSARKRRKPNTTSEPRSVTSVEFLGGGHELATAGAADGVVKIWDLRRLTARRKIPLQGSINSATTPLRSFACGSGATRGVTSLALDPVSRHRLLVSVLHGDLCVLDVHARDAETAVALRLEGHAATSFFVKAAFSPDGDFCVSGSGDGAAFVWDARGTQRHTRAPLAALKAHEAEVNGVAWHASDFGTLATCSDDGTVRVWHANRREQDDEEAETQGFCLRRSVRTWQNWQAWETQESGRAYAVESTPDEPEDDQEDEEMPKVASPESPSEAELPSTPIAVRPREVASGGSAQRKRTLLDFWGR